jgi:protoporphyrinogen IX oxidase
MADIYPWIKALHVVAVIAFMAGMLYLPRLFVYHAAAAKGSAEAETFKLMERRLDRMIMRPALFLVWASGIALALISEYFRVSWLQAKVGLVVLMTANYLYLVRARHALALGENRHSPRYFRIINEIPTLLMIAIVILAVVKPWDRG